MEKNWFIINNDHHRGPFSSTDIEKLLDNGKLAEDTMIWKESLDDWTALGLTKEFSGFFCPEVPSIPVVVKEVVHFPDLSEIEVVELPNLMVDKQVNFSDRYAAPLKYCIASISVIFAIFVTYLVSNNSTKKASFTKLKRKEFKRLKEHKNAPFKEKLNMDFAFSKKANTLWASSNIEGPATMYLNLKSIDGRVISDTPVVMNSTAKLNGKAIKFEQFVFDKGSKLAAGEYEATVVSVKTGLKTKTDKFLGKRVPANRNLKYKGRVNLYGKSKKVFEKKLKTYRRNKRLEKNLPLQDRIEKYRTLGALVDRLGKIYGKSIHNMKRPGKMRKFEIDYGMSVGPILQGIILDNHKQARTLRRKKPVRAKKYIRLLEYGKRIGELASDMMTITSKFKVLTKSKRAHLKLIFAKKVNDLKTLGNMRLKKLTHTR